MIRRPPRSTQGVSSAASDVYKRQGIVAFNEDTHRLVAKGRLVPAMIECIKERCNDTECSLNFKDFRDKDVCDHSTALLRNLSHNSAQHNLLKASGTVDVLLDLMGARSGAVRINSACTVANLVGREEADSRLEEDPTIIEEVLEAVSYTHLTLPTILLV